MRADPLVSHSWQLTVATRLSYILEEQRPGKKFTFIVPTNTAWENVRRDFSKVFKSLTDLNNPDFVSITDLIHKYDSCIEQCFGTQEQQRHVLYITPRRWNYLKERKRKFIFIQHILSALG